MSKVTLDAVTGGFDLSKINANFQKIQTELNSKVLYRNNTSGEDNALVTDIDVNSVKIYNVPTPELSSQVVPKDYVDSRTLYTAFIWRGGWAATQLYKIFDAVKFNGSSYICIVEHTSIDFLADLAVGKWDTLAQAGSSGSGTGDMVAANNLSDLTNPADARNNLGLGTAATQASSAFATAAHLHGGVYEPVDANIVRANAITAFTAPQRSAHLTDNDLSFDMSAKQNFKCTPTATGALTFVNLVDGQSGYIILVNSANYVITKAASIKCSSTMLTTISATGTYKLAYDCDGTNVYVTNSAALS